MKIQNKIFLSKNHFDLPMRDEINLKEFLESIPNFLIKIENDFLVELFTKASGLDKPWRDENFTSKIGYTFNEKANSSPGMYSVIRSNKSIKVFTLIKLMQLSGCKWNNLQKNIISIRAGRHNGEVKMEFPIIFNKDFGCVIGHILGDGSIDKKYSQVFYTNSNIELIEEFREAMKNIFSIEPRTWIQKPDFYKGAKWVERISPKKIPKGKQIGLFYPTTCGKILQIIFGKFAHGKQKETTSIILNGPREFQISLIRAFFDDEGYVDLYRSLRYHNDNLEVLNGLKQILKYLGIESKPIRTYIKNNKMRGFFNICSYHNLKKYSQIIDITSSKKKERLSELLNHIESGPKFKSIIQKINQK